MGNLFWIGPRQSDIFDTENLFKGSITLFGNGEDGNVSLNRQYGKRVNHNIITNEQIAFFKEQQLRVMQEYSDVSFMMYNPVLTYQFGDNIIRRTCCLNEKDILHLTHKKSWFRKWASEFVKVFQSDYLPMTDCNYSALRSRYGERVVIQSDVSSGGYGTIVMDKSNATEIEEILGSNRNKSYLVSPYMEKNIPINIHAIIFEDDVVLTPASIQIVTNTNGKLLYRGADFISYHHEISNDIHTRFLDGAHSLCEELGRKGYRGVCGIDAMIIDGTVYFLEMNNRFQASTALVNKALAEKCLPSLHKLHYEAFFNCKPSVDISNVAVNYSTFVYMNTNMSDTRHNNHILNYANREKNIIDVVSGCKDGAKSIVTDGYNSADIQEKDSYSFKAIFNTNITSISPEATVRLHPNIPERDMRMVDDYRKNLLALKIALLNQGIVVSKRAEQYFEDRGGVQEGVFNAVDIFLGDIIINSPCCVKLVALSPFSLDYNKELQKFYIMYYDTSLMDVGVCLRDAIGDLKTTKHKKAIKEICWWATDRIRIQHSCFCFYKEQDVGCKFCEVGKCSHSFDLDDVFEAVDKYLYLQSELKFTHILIGGRSGTENYGESEKILAIVKHIRKSSDMPIYLMCLPPKNTEILNKYHAAGVTEISFNIEVFDRAWALKYMPGKGDIPLQRYLDALETAVMLWGRTGNVRSAFIVGLEPHKSLMEGIATLCKLGVAPILSVFRPLPETEMSNVIPPCNEELHNLYKEAQKICACYGLALGPACTKCQNNTLSFNESLT